MKRRAAFSVVLLVLVAAALLVWQLVGDDDAGPGDGRSAEELTADDPAGPERDRPAMLRGVPRAEGDASEPGQPQGTVTSKVTTSTPTAPKGGRPPAAKAPKHYRIAGPSGDASTGTLRVRVVDEDGHPRESAKLRVHSLVDGVVQVTHEGPIGPTGELEVSSLPPARTSLWVDRKGTRRNAWVEIQAGSITEIDVLFPRGAVVEGVVRHVVKGPQAKVRIGLKRSEGPYSDHLDGMTDEEGRYRFEEVPPGRYPVSLQGEVIGYHPRPRDTLVVTGPGTVTKDFVLGTVTLRGSVREADTGRPIAGVRVQLQKPFYNSTSTDGQGQYQFFDVPPGTWPLVLTRDGYETRFGKTGEIVAGEVRVADFVLRRAAALVLTITDTEGRALPGRTFISISARDSEDGTSLGTSITADETGRASYPRIAPGPYVIGIRRDGFDPWSQPVDVGSGENAVEVRLVRKVPDESEKAAVSMQGTVRDKESGRPIPGVTVSIQSPLHRNATTDTEGNYSFTDLRPTKHLLIVFKDGYGIRFLRDVEVKAAAVRVFDIELAPAGSLHVELIDARGEPVVGRVGLVVNPVVKGEGTRVSTSIRADAEGRATYRRIEPGRYKLRFIKEGAGSAEVEADIGLGETRVAVRLE